MRTPDHRVPLVELFREYCVAGHGIAQTIEFGLDSLLASGELVQILADWAGERFPLYAYHPSGHLPPVKVRAFLDFVVASIPPPSSRRNFVPDPPPCYD